MFTGAVAAFLAKLLWRDKLKGVAWWRLCRWSAAVCTAVLLGGLVVFGRDGRMATYAAMVGGCALTLWTVGFIPHRR